MNVRLERIFIGPFALCGQFGLAQPSTRCGPHFVADFHRGPQMLTRVTAWFLKLCFAVLV